MGRRKELSVNRPRKIKVKGRGLLNTLINKLPFEIHVPGYNYCGPGTKLSKRLERGDRGVNPLDEACKQHDIAYSKFQDIQSRNLADKELAAAAFKRVKAPDARFGEKLAALGITGTMKVKNKLGMGLKRRKRKCKKSGQGLKKKVLIRNKRHRSKQRIIPIPKVGGFLPFLLPLIAALGAAGGGAAGIAKAVNDAKADRAKAAEEKRHNLVMEQAATGTGKGYFLRPYRKGSGLSKGKGYFLRPYKKGSGNRNSISKNFQ